MERQPSVSSDSSAESQRPSADLPGTTRMMQQYLRIKGEHPDILLSLSRDESTVGLAWLSLASGALRVAEVAPQALANELRRIGPAEVLVADDFMLDGFFVTRLPAWHFDVDSGKRKLLQQLGAATLAGYGCEDLTVDRRVRRIARVRRQDARSSARARHRGEGRARRRVREA